MATQFQDPTDPAQNDGDNELPKQSEFEVPSEEGALDAEAADTTLEALLSTVDSQLISAKLEIEKLLGTLHSQSASTASAQADDVVLHNIVGVGIGLGSDDSFAGPPGQPVLELYAIEPEAPSELKARLASTVGVSSLASADFPVNVIRTGIIDAFPHRFRERPAPGGISVGHRDITAGTLGCLARGLTSPRANRLLVLSNNHVLANSNAGRIGDPILQPGPADGGRDPGDKIAILERFVPINFAPGSFNYVDAATGWAWPDRVRPEHVYLSGGTRHYFRVGTTPVAPTPGLIVGKTGRTTQLTRGTVTAIGVTINVTYPGGRVAQFRDQVRVQGSAGDFSAGGDSGSLIWTWDARRAPVALLFAGGGGSTFGNRITRVLSALDIRIVA